MILSHDGLDHLADVSGFFVADDVLDLLVEMIAVHQKLKLLRAACYDVSGVDIKQTILATNGASSGLNAFIRSK